MLKFLRVQGDSLSPAYQDGDYVLVSQLPILKPRFKPGDVIAFTHPAYGLLIKQVSEVHGEQLTVTGSHPASVDSRTFGTIHRQTVIGKVLWHIAPRRKS